MRLSFAQAVRLGSMCEPPLGIPAMPPILAALAELGRDLFAIVEQDLPVRTGRAAPHRDADPFVLRGTRHRARSSRAPTPGNAHRHVMAATATSVGRGHRPLRVGLIGCGNVALNHHLPAYLAMPDRFELVAIADSIAERLEVGRDAAGLDGTRAHLDPLALLARDDLDMVDLCTPQHVRRDLAIATVESGRHLLSEKPIATTPADATADDRGTRPAPPVSRFGIVHNYLFFAEVRADAGAHRARRDRPGRGRVPGLAGLR